MPAALALSPDQIFEKVAPSVWVVRGLDATERPISYGSGVVSNQYIPPRQFLLSMNYKF